MGAVAAPKQDLASRRAALAVANRYRFLRAALRREMKGLPPSEGRALIADVFARNPVEFQAMHAIELLGMARRAKREGATIATRRGEAMLDACGAGYCRTLGGLSPRQREFLANALWANIRGWS